MGVGNWEKITANVGHEFCRQHYLEYHCKTKQGLDPTCVPSSPAALHLFNAGHSYGTDKLIAVLDSHCGETNFKRRLLQIYDHMQTQDFFITAQHLKQPRRVLGLDGKCTMSPHGESSCNDKKALRAFETGLGEAKNLRSMLVRLDPRTTGRKELMSGFPASICCVEGV